MTPNSFTSFSQLILFPDKLKVMLLYISFLPTAKAWNLSGLFSFDYILTNLFQTNYLFLMML